MQRRRWINGALAATLFLTLKAPGLIFRSKGHSLYFKAASFFLLIVQCLSAFSTTLASALLCSILYTTRYKYAESGSLAYMAIFLVFVISHHRTVFRAWFFHLVTLMNALLAAVIMVTVLINFVEVDYLVIVPVAVVLLFPFLLAWSHSIDVFVLMLQNFVPFILFQMTFALFFNGYSISRLW
jgi:hypothetical protein